MYQRILLPLDGSAFSEQALPYAAAQAEHFQAELILLRVLPPLPTSRGQESSASKWAEDYTADLARQYLENIAATIEEQNVRTQITIIEGHPHQDIVKYAEENDVDLIVMCTHGHTGFSRWLMGSVADRVVRGANVPVLLVRARSETPQSADALSDSIKNGVT